MRKTSDPTARIIVDEARRRGIHAEIIDGEGGLFRLSWGGRSVRCRESLSELTSAVALSICDDKRMTRRIVEAAGAAGPPLKNAEDIIKGLSAIIGAMSATWLMRRRIVALATRLFGRRAANPAT